MGAGASIPAPFESEEAALSAGKTREEIAAWLAVNINTKPAVESFHHDESFPPGPESLGMTEPAWMAALGMTSRCVCNEVNGWIRAPELGERTGALFDTISPNDIEQKSLRHCWLLSAISALAEFPALIKGMFVEQEYQPTGRYHVRLYDVTKQERVTVEIDDLIPCHNKRPAFSNPQNNEMWVLLLEKAIAKFVGGYGKLELGFGSFALQVLSGGANAAIYGRGDLAIRFATMQFGVETAAALAAGGLSAPGAWACFRGAPAPDPRSLPFRMESGVEAWDAEGLWSRLLKADAANQITVASTTSLTTVGEAVLPTGLVANHVYSLMGVSAHTVEVAVGGGGEGGSGSAAFIPTIEPTSLVRLVKLRNPWGDEHEWNGAWSDHSELWNAHPEVRSRVGFAAGADGAFYMSFGDFLSSFTLIETVAVGRGRGGSSIPSAGT